MQRWRVLHRQYADVSSLKIGQEVRHLEKVEWGGGCKDRELALFICKEQKAAESKRRGE